MEFIQNLTELSESPWFTLMQCPQCKQYWRVDKRDKLQTRFAIKLGTDEDWEEKDTVALQKEFLIENRGGLTTEECLRVDCQSSRVKDSAYCVDHLYETGVRK